MGQPKMIKCRACGAPIEAWRHKCLRCGKNAHFGVWGWLIGATVLAAFLTPVLLKSC